MPEACLCPAPVSQAPREVPARRAPSSALYLEEKSDQQKKEEVGTEEGWPWGGRGIPLVVVALHFCNLTQIGTGASVSPLSVGELDGETLMGRPSRALTLTAAAHGLRAREPGKGRARPRPGLAQATPTRARDCGPKCIWDPGAHLSI